MKINVPDFDIARGLVEEWAEYGISGKTDYDPDTGQWSVILNDKQYIEHLKNLEKCHDRMCSLIKTFEKRWSSEATNSQIVLPEPPQENEQEIMLYLADVECGTVKGFKAKTSVQKLFLNRKTAILAYGSTCSSCGKRMMAILAWEDTKSKT